MLEWVLVLVLEWRWRLGGRSENGTMFRSLLCPDFYLFYLSGENPDTKANAPLLHIHSVFSAV
ncbi:hypothetical protein [Paenibacillus sp. FSL R7-0333]|uniref:hypothetical protein n=1 Tax=Paenibacillus sp. FSL R7-0333 TaxID=1926587 RepID=UPI001180062A